MAANEGKKEVPAIYASLAEVMKGLANIPKNGRMQHGNVKYDYLKADDVQEKLNPLLIENGIIVQSQYTTRDVEKSGRWYVYVDLRLNYVSVKDGSMLASNATGESIAGDDKSTNKALTQAIKNCHRAMFQFTSGEAEPDDVTPGSDSGAKSTPPALKKARESVAKPKKDDTIGGDSIALIKAEFTDNDESKITGDDVKALAEEISADKKIDSKSNREKLYSEVLRRLRSDKAAGKHDKESGK